MHEEGSITERDEEKFTTATSEMLIKVHWHPLTERLPTKVDMLLGVDFLRGVPRAEVIRVSMKNSLSSSTPDMHARTRENQYNTNE